MPKPEGINLVFHSICAGGGMERYVLDVIGECSRRGIQVRGITRKAHWPGEQPAGVELVVVQDRTPFSRLNNYLFEKKALDYCQPEWPTIGISRVVGCVDLAIVGGTHIGHLQDKGKTRRGIFDRLTVAHERGLYENAGHIVAHSARVRDEIIGLYSISAGRVSTLYPPVDTSKFNLDARLSRERVRQELGIRDDQFMLLFPSNNHKLKGADLILEAIAEYGDRVVLAVAGKAPLDTPGVLNLGMRQDMPELYAAADATILASKYEAFGLVGPESILCGTPVLFARTVGAAEVLDKVACYTFERTADGIVNALNSVMNKEHLSINGDSILYVYAISSHVDELLKLMDF
ncbi:glycosyltransferase family 4 protein [Craterilacuibacter sp. RT1T]|uniref:glycosyltransferase family 4 protein n=1 Tax=Craterilacuibacter sp. RT1T TaxID=2942211 RepID=UPI0020BECE43|nr:glycosyltransferase family 4 protein [Craterilacuibacter sp. RT1T]MCL6264424.1 glycosyltransferase family 4 protein [Craterilacuibacter sp. RT1T]